VVHGRATASASVRRDGRGRRAQVSIVLHLADLDSHYIAQLYLLRFFMGLFSDIFINLKSNLK